VLKDAAHSSSLPPANCAFSAVLLAGGKSSRMGRDKAGVLLDGHPLWQRQLATLRRLEPPELFISGKWDGAYVGAAVEVVPDVTPGCGPLSGIEASLCRAVHPLLLVLAIDLPAMTPEFLSRLIHSAVVAGTGVVPRLDGWFEPLAAVYPRRCLPLVQECLRSDDLSMQAFIRRALAANLVVPWELAAQDAGLFRNVNSPADLPHD
jgi:molybdopterin-guanine dinucleotide biosynthesis protein A